MIRVGRFQLTRRWFFALSWPTPEWWPKAQNLWYRKGDFIAYAIIPIAAYLIFAIIYTNVI